MIAFTRLRHALSRATVLCLACSAAGLSHSQGYMVKPMSVEASAKSSVKSDIKFEITNTSADKGTILDLSLQFLGQNQAGWYAVEEAKAPAEDKEKYPSCLPWLTLDEKELEVKPLENKAISLHLNPPSTAKGLYTAALIVQSRPGQGGKVGLVIRFLIPIMIQIEGGGTPYRKVTAVSPFANYTPAKGNGEAMLNIAVLTRNAGRGLTRITGKLDLYAQVGENWLPVTTVDAISRRIIPGAEVLVGGTTKKRIPSGHYRVEANLKADGQTMPKFSGELDVVGDPKVQAITPDAAVLVDPTQLEVSAQAGALRSGFISLRNPTNSTVTMNLKVATPKVLEGVSMGTVLGTDLSGAAWTSLGQDSITLGPRQTGKVRVTVSVPEGSALPYYYSEITGSTLVNGEPAGTSTMLVVAKNGKVASSPAMKPGSPLAISLDSRGKYIGSVKFVNTGDSIVTPKVRYAITDGAQLTAFAEFATEGDSDTLLPLSTANFTGTIELDKLKPGTYALVATASFGGKEPTQVVVPVRVSKGKTGLEIAIVDSNKKAPAKGKGQ